MDEMPASVTACNCSACARYGVLWGYGYEGTDVHISGASRPWFRPSGSSLGFHFCPECGCVGWWLSRQPDDQGRRRVAVNLRLTDPGAIARLPVDHFDGLASFADLPRDGRCVRDMWF